MKVASLIVAIFAARFFAVAVYYPKNDGDLGWQRWLGGVILRTHALPRTLGTETFSAPGAPWVPQEWLFAIAAYVGQSQRWPAFAALCAIAATATLLFGAWRARRRETPSMAVALTMVFFALALFESFGVRDQVWAWPFLALFLSGLELQKPSVIFGFTVVALWSNIHASVTIAPALAAVYSVGSLFETGSSARTRRLALVTLVSMAAVCMNPLGSALPRYALALVASPFKSLIFEWQHTDFSDLSFTFGALPLLLLLAIFGVAGPRRWTDRLLVAVGLLLMFLAKRNIAIFAIICFPIATRSLAAAIPFFARPDRQLETALEKRVDRYIPAFAALVAVGLGCVLVGKSAAEPDSATALQPALAAIRALDGRNDVFCADFAWCSFLLDGPQRVFLDGRADPYPRAVWDDFRQIIEIEPGWNATLHRRRIDVVLVEMTSPLEQALELSAGWSSRYRNAQYRVWTAVPASIDPKTAWRTQQESAARLVHKPE